eukprot:6577593-Pyramimonas_sp.AAC.1
MIPKSMTETMTSQGPPLRQQIRQRPQPTRRKKDSLALAARHGRHRGEVNEKVEQRTADPPGKGVDQLITDNNTAPVETAQKYYCQAPKPTDYRERLTKYTERLIARLRPNRRPPRFARTSSNPGTCQGRLTHP